jgi:malonate-semialdehyde dehydrogenase (acetylating)/methylmalonate-semialdehyde dehydrogenase
MSTLAAPDLKSPASTSLREITHWLGGKAVPGTSGRSSDVYNPATGKVQAKVPLANASELHAAVDAARRAFPEWAAQPPLRRARVLFRFRELFEQHLEEFAAIITSEHGKVLSDPDRRAAQKGWSARRHLQRGPRR